MVRGWSSHKDINQLTEVGRSVLSSDGGLSEQPEIETPGISASVESNLGFVGFVLVVEASKGFSVERTVVGIVLEGLLLTESEIVLALLVEDLVDSDVVKSGDDQSLHGLVDDDSSVEDVKLLVLLKN